MSRIETIGDATLYLGDCREILPTLGKVEAVVTDPPYGIARVWQGGSGHGWGAAKEKATVRNEWDEESPPIDLLMQLANAPQAIIWGANHFSLPPSRSWLVWRKEVNPALTLGDAELAWTNFDQPVRVFDHPRSKLTGALVPPHPTQKPVALMQWCVSKTKGVVLDPFMGSGTTGVACLSLGRKFVGIEVHEPYFDIACKRAEEQWKQPRLFEEPKAKPVTVGDLFELPADVYKVE